MAENTTVLGVAGLPEPTTAFIGREAELSALGAALRGPRRLVTLVGPGGIGKTRLAVRAASRWQSPEAPWARPLPVADEVFGPVFAPLANVTEPHLVPAAVLDAAAIGAHAGRPPINAVIDHVGDQPGLLILDNCEHLTEAAGHVVESLLEGCPELRVLATSREPLGVQGEAVWQVPPLPTRLETVADPGAPPSDAARLFLDRSGDSVGADCPDASRDAVEHIVHELDGIPLAIELAAARGRVTSPCRIAADLGRSVLALISGGPGAGGDARNSTMRRSLDWSHALLTAEEAALFRRLSVFEGGWTLPAAEHVCADGAMPPDALRDHLMALIDKSLVDVAQHARETRYRMLSPIRQYAAEHQAAHERAYGPDDAAARHRSWFLAVAERADEEMWAFDPDGQARLDQEAPNLRAALEHAVRAGHRDALRFGAALGSYWRVKGRYAEGVRVLGRVLETAPDADHWSRARVLAMRAMLVFWRGDLEHAMDDATSAVAMAERVGDQRAHAHALNRIGTATMMMRPSAGQPLLERAVAVAREAGDMVALADAYSSLSTSFVWQDDYPGMAEVADLAEPVFRRSGFDAGRFWAIWGRSHGARLAGDLETARELADQGLALADGSDVLLGNAAVEGRAVVDIMTGEAQRARQAVLAELARSQGNAVRWGSGVLQLALAAAELALGNPDTAHDVAAALFRREREGAGYLAWHAQELRMLAALAEGDAAAAAEHAGLVSGLAERLGNRRAQAVAERGLARAALLRGDLAGAEAYAHTALTAGVDNGWWVDTMDVLETLAVLAARRGRHDRAVRLFSGVRAARVERGLVRFPEEKTWWDAQFAEAWTTAPDPRMQAVEPGAVTLRQLAEFAARGRGSRGRPVIGPESLTPMQLNVARLAARGFTNADIAAELFIARGTVKSHLAHVFAKLGVGNRTELAALGLSEHRP
ncbi:helix-turn-helix transcriptional regulator [Yinghuangia sp. YIM S09857]|uniref:helix-turn-helix transcriptional regulator n=1 Tax=Yinghuangia sp. YIM S09857 TaxID=3436929 RepID=UPI003F53700C